jgi:hypothetical protein
MANQQNIIPPSNGKSSSLLSILESFLTNKAKNIHTQIVCEVVKVHHKKGSVDVQPLIKTMWQPESLLSSGIEGQFPVIFQVPVKRESAKRGKTGIRLPVTVGDIGVLQFSERNSELYLDSDGESIVDSGTVITHSMDGVPQVLCYSGEVFTEAKPFEIPEDELFLEYGGSKINLKEDSAHITVSSGANVNLNPDGTGTINGAIVTADGDIITSDGISLRELNAQFQAHTHTESGGGETQPPTS